MILKHLLIKTEGQKNIVDPIDAIVVIKDLVARIGMKLQMEPIANYLNVPGLRGISATALIETSSINLHIWDESWPDVKIQLDIFSCKEVDLDIITAFLKDTFGINWYLYMTVNRDTMTKEEESFILC